MPSTRASAEGHPDGRDAVLSLARLGVTFHTAGGPVSAVREVTLSVARGECLGVLGESGAGKSQVFLAVMGLLAANAHAQGSARFNSQELLGLTPAALDRVRGAGIAMVFQDPLTSLTPHFTTGAQIAEVARRHRGLSRTQARSCALALLERLHVNDPERRLGQYPHELSGGMRQRVMLAIALASEPQLLIADEPTTSLDVTIQAQILALLAELKRERGMALVLITHDVAVLAGLADRVAVMRAGSVIEEGTVRAVLNRPQQPHTRALLQSAPGLADAPEPLVRLGGTDRPVGAPAAGRGGPAVRLKATDLSLEYAIARGWLAPAAHLAALSHVSLELLAGESLGIVGESGAGKSTLARAVLQLLKPSAGRVVWLGRELGQLPPRELRALRRHVQVVFQDPLGSLDPRMRVDEIVAEPLRVHEPALDAAGRSREVATMLASVGLAPELAGRYPHQLSGGECQRVGIARAMILKPRLLVCDEPVSALDAPTQQQIVALLSRLKCAAELSLLFISHNLAVVRRLCERVLVLYLGRMMEVAPAAVLFAHTRHPYSRELLAAIPSADPDIQPARLTHVLTGEPPSPLSPPSGCVYRTRCPHAIAVCAERVPEWEDLGGGHRVACHRWRELGVTLSV